MPKTEADKKGAWESHHSVLGAMEAHLSLMIPEGEVGAIGTADEATMGYYVIKWLSEPYTLQEETEGMSGMIGVGTMVATMLYFNQVEGARHWDTQSNRRRESGIDWSMMSTMMMTAMRARKRVRRRARRRVRRRASQAMVRSSRASTARGTRRMMLL